MWGCAFSSTRPAPAAAHLVIRAKPAVVKRRAALADEEEGGRHELDAMGAQPCRGLRGRPATHHRMSAHVKPRIATHFAYPLEPAKGLGASCGAGTAPADLTVTRLAKAAIRVFRARGLHAASGQDDSIRARRGQKICPASPSACRYRRRNQKCHQYRP